MLNNLLNAMALTVIVAIAAAAAFGGAPSKDRAPVAQASASAPVKVVQLPTVVIVGQRDRTVAAR